MTGIQLPAGGRKGVGPGSVLGLGSCPVLWKLVESWHCKPSHSEVDAVSGGQVTNVYPGGRGARCSVLVEEHYV